MSQSGFIQANLLLVLLQFNISNGCRRRQTGQGFLLSTISLRLPWTMNDDVTQTLTQARYVMPPTRVRAKKYFVNYDSEKGILHFIVSDIHP